MSWTASSDAGAGNSKSRSFDHRSSPVRQSVAHRRESRRADHSQLGVARRVEPELELEQQPHAAALVVVTDEAAPQLVEPAVEVGRAVDALAEVDDRLPDPELEQGDEQALLPAEVVVERAGRPVGGVGDRFGRGGVVPLQREQVGGGREQLRPGLGAPFLLGAGHPARLHRITYVCTAPDISGRIRPGRSRG